MVTGYLHTSGIKIKDSLNNDVILRGLHLGGYFIYHYIAYGEDYLDYINQPFWQSYADAGCNIIRFNGVFWGQMETSKPANNGVPTDVNMNSVWVTWLDKMATYAKNTKMYLIIQIRDLNGGDGNLPPNGDGQGMLYPDWLVGVGTMINSTPTADEFDQQFFTPSNSSYNDVRQAYHNFMKYLAIKYHDNPFIILGSFNEPLWSVGFNDPSWEANYISVTNDTCTAMRNGTGYVNPIVIDVPMPNYGRANYGSYNPIDVSDSNIIWDAHPYSGCNKNFAEWEFYIKSFTVPYITNLRRPMLFGEWAHLTEYPFLQCNNIQNPQESDAVFLTAMTDMVSWMNNNGIAGSTWFSNESLYGCVGAWQGENQASTIALMGILFVGGTGHPIIDDDDGSLVLPFHDAFTDPALPNWIKINGNWNGVN